MLRPVAYWQNWPSTGSVSTIWGGGNPASWWGAFVAIVIVAIQAVKRRSLWRSFLVIGYLSYIVIWAPNAAVGRTLFLYHYMPAEYLGYLALAAVLAECWNEGAQQWEQAALLLALVPVLVLGLPNPWDLAGLSILLGGYTAIVLQRPRYAGKLVCGAFVAAVAILFFYYIPVWVGLPIDRAGYYARMWLQGPGLRSWI
jgi:dolichyl-phosphate-mannose--protein O-mannosyl transferase